MDISDKIITIQLTFIEPTVCPSTILFAEAPAISQDPCPHEVKTEL